MRVMTCLFGKFHAKLRKILLFSKFFDALLCRLVTCGDGVTVSVAVSVAACSGIGGVLFRYFRLIFSVPGACKPRGSGMPRCLRRGTDGCPGGLQGWGSGKVVRGLPAGFLHAGDEALGCHLAELDTADAEHPHITLRSSGERAAVVHAARA